MINKIINSPIKLIIITIILFSISILLKDFYDGSLSIFFLIPILSIFVFSVLHSIYKKKWIRLIISFLSYLFMLVIYVCVLFIVSQTQENIIVGNNSFYINKFNENLDISLPLDTKIICKNDTIIGIGPGGGDYTASCIFKTNYKDFIRIQRSIMKDSSFHKISIEEAEWTSDFSIKCLKTIEFSKAYRAGGSCIIFSKDNKHILFSLSYY
jgi:hypothetical protein